MNTVDQAHEIMEAVATDCRIPGMSVAIAAPDRLLYAGAVGYADLATRRPASVQDQYPWFSMTKIATATTAMRLYDEGILDLDAPIGQYLPGYRPHPEHGHPTVRQLLTHTAGLGNPLPVRWVRLEDDPADPAVLARIAAKHGTPRRATGSRPSYSNIGYLLAGEVITAATGKTIERCVHEGVLDPLGMTHTSYTYRSDAPRSVGYVRTPRALVPLLRAALPSGVVGARADGHTALNPFLISGAAYGGLIGNVTDAVRLAAAHAADASGPESILSHAQLEAMRTITATGKRFDHGIGWFRKPADATRTPAFVEHYGTGCGYWNAMRIYPGQGLALVVMTNTTFAWDVDRLFTELKDLSWN
ncbi:MAG: serine hydrolase domain-containing protein [Nocardioides sp.]|uniref:serine hydrolase domain-containing protein n=1 Tax=Nocardioides sp. TaxID=35761 RepID=UPI003266F49C